MRKDCNNRVKWIVIQAASTDIRHDGRLGDCYDRVKARHGGNHGIAVSHVATKMIMIMWHMLSTMTPYSTRDNGLYQKKLKRRKA